MGSRRLRVVEVLDANPVTSPFQLRICLICLLLIILDGFDLFIIGVAAPKLAAFLHSKPSSLGLAMSASQIGGIIGAVVLGMLADRIGRKWLVITSSLVFGLFTLLTVGIHSIEELALLRLIAGVGLGGAVTNALAFGSEYAPSRLRKTFAAVMFAGMPMGALVGGLLAAWFIPQFGWRSLFLFGGVAPIAIALLSIAILPESLEFLTIKGKDKARIRNIVARIAPVLARDEEVEFCPSEEKLPGVPLKNLFTEKRGPVTILFWLALAGAFYFVNILVLWEPWILHSAGATVTQYTLAYAAYNVGSPAGTIISGRLMDRYNPFLVLPVGFAVGFLCLVAFGLSLGSPFIMVVILSVICGFFISGSQCGTMALAAVSYPPDIRGTAVGWGYAAAKIGNWCAPVVVGYLLALGWGGAKICIANALVGLFCAVMILLLRGRSASAERFRSERALAVGMDR
jgi:AAHS family 4-hydroxybenzoate transporter-like MFS transporter